MQGAALSLAKYIFGEVLGDLVYAPVWWYSRGLIWFLGRLRDRVVGFERTLGLGFWIRTLGKPMYGQYDIAGKIISFLMRIVVLIFRVVVFMFYCVWLIILLALWILVPPLVIWQMVSQFMGLIAT